MSLPRVAPNPRTFLAAGLALTVAVGSTLLLLGARSARADFATDCANPTQTFPVGGVMPTNLNLTSSDVVLFASGTFTGSVNNSLGTICVAAGAAFNPSNINGTSRLFVRGTALMPPLAAGSGAVLDNEGFVTFEPQPNVNGVADIINRAGATIVVEGPGLALNATTTVTNDGTIDVAGGVNLNGSTVTNNGELSVGGPFDMTGSVTNNGHAVVNGLFTVDSGGTLTNACSLLANGLINDQTVNNNGVADLGGFALTNNGNAVYAQGDVAITTGGNFTNTGTVNGSGQYLFSGTTLTEGTVAGASAADPIVFFDSSPTGAQIFDTQLGTVTNTVRAPVTPPDAGACNTSPPTTTTTSSTTTTTTSSTTTTTTSSTTTTTTEPPTTTTSSTTSSTTTSTSTTTTEPPTTTTSATSTSTSTSTPPTTSPETLPATSTSTSTSTSSSSTTPVTSEGSTSTTTAAAAGSGSTPPPASLGADEASGSSAIGAGTLPFTGGGGNLVVVAALLVGLTGLGARALGQRARRGR